MVLVLAVPAEGSSGQLYVACDHCGGHRFHEQVSGRSAGPLAPDVTDVSAHVVLEMKLVASVEGSAFNLDPALEVRVVTEEVLRFS